MRQYDILQKAFDEGGTERVIQVLDEVRDMEDARFDLIQRRLDTNSARFSEVAESAKAETKALEKDIAELESIAKVLGTITKIVNLVGRILIRFGL
jgi:hypothetical protein